MWLSPIPVHDLHGCDFFLHAVLNTGAIRETLTEPLQAKLIELSSITKAIQLSYFAKSVRLNSVIRHESHC